MSEDSVAVPEPAQGQPAGEPRATPGGPEHTLPTGQRGASQGERKRSKSEGKSFLRELAVIVVTALVLSAIVRTFLVQAFYVPTGSMEQTLLVGDRILVQKFDPTVDRGDIVVFKDPANWLPDPEPATGFRGTLTSVLSFVGLIPDPNSDALVKRVIGVGGDTVECCDPRGRIIVNGKPLDEAYINGPTDQMAFKVKVPPGRLFVMGDNRGDSADSRFHMTENQGTVAESDVIGPVILLMWPLGRFGVPD